jgi:hypothetical protein
LVVTWQTRSDKAKDTGRDKPDDAERGPKFGIQVPSLVIFRFGLPVIGARSRRRSRRTNFKITLKKPKKSAPANATHRFLGPMKTHPNRRKRSNESRQIRAGRPLDF